MLLIEFIKLFIYKIIHFDELFPWRITDDSLQTLFFRFLFNFILTLIGCQLIIFLLLKSPILTI